MFEITLLLYNEYMNKKFLIYIITSAVLLFTAGWFSGGYYREKNINNNLNQIRENSGKYKLVNRLLFVDNSETQFFDFGKMEESLIRYINFKKKNSEANKISVYYRDLNTGKWAGINEKEKYIPSSMLKVPTLIAYLKMAENNPDILRKEVEYDPKDDPGQYYKPSKLLSPGIYKVHTLLQETILKSENTASKILNDLYMPEILKVYDNLHIPDPTKKDGTDNDFISPEEYSSIFRVLYNSSYLRESSSETVLELLTLTEFDRGIVGGVSSGTIIAHKFGEHTKKLNDIVTERQLHDCGIVYYPEHPYFLCVMTSGMNFEKLQKILSEISKIVFEEVSKKYPI